MRRLMAGIRSEKRVIRRFRRCENVIECTFTNLGSTVWGHAVAQLVEALRYKPGGRGFDSRWYR